MIAFQNLDFRTHLWYIISLYSVGMPVVNLLKVVNTKQRQKITVSCRLEFVPCTNIQVVCRTINFVTFILYTIRNEIHFLALFFSQLNSHIKLNIHTIPIYNCFKTVVAKVCAMAPWGASASSQERHEILQNFHSISIVELHFLWS